MGRGGGKALSDIPHGVEGESLLHASPWRGEGTEKLSDSLPPEVVVVVGGARDLCMCVEGGDRREE